MTDHDTPDLNGYRHEPPQAWLNQPPQEHRHPDDLSIEEAIHALVHAQGNPGLAAERLNMRSADELLAVIALSPDAQDRMRGVMRNFMMVRLLGLAQNLEATLMDKLEYLNAAELSKLFLGILQMAEMVTKSAAPQAGANSAATAEALLKILPPEVRTAFQVIQAEQGPDLSRVLDTSLAPDTHSDHSHQTGRTMGAA